MTDSAELLAAADELTDPPRRQHLCVVCPQLRTKSTPRQYHRAHVCEPCRVRLADLLAEVAECYPLLPASLDRGLSSAERVSGGEVEAPLPFREDVWDLLLPVRPAVTGLAPATDQIGCLSVATILHGWVRDWCETRAMGEVGPDPTVDGLTGWMTGRLDWLCDEHPAVDEFAGELRDLADALRRYSGTSTPKPRPCRGVPCRRCDLMTLARLADGSGDIECQNAACRTIYRPEDYDRWTRLLAATVTRG